MKDIIRYDFRNAGQAHTSANPTGDWCRWSDVEALQKELINVTAKALAAVWLASAEEVDNHQLRDVYEEARQTLMGEDKKKISRLEDRITTLLLELDHIKKPELPGVRSVSGWKTPGTTLYALAIESVSRDPQGHFVIEVRLP